MAYDPNEIFKRGGMDPNSVMASPAGNSKTPGGGEKVYVGPQFAPSPQDLYTRPGASRPGEFVRAPSTEMSYDEAKGLPLKWMTSDPAKLREFVNTGILRKIPGFDVGMGMPEIMSAWDDLLTASWGMNKVGGKSPTGGNWSPFDIMNTYSNSGFGFGTVRKGDWLYDIATGEKVKYVGPKSKTTTQKRVDLSSPEDVKALTTQMLSELLGRSPTAEELAKYKMAINSYEEAHPTIATTTETLNDMGEVVSTSTKTEGGVSSEGRGTLISDEAKKGPEYGKYQSGTTYWNAFMQMLGA